MKIKDCALRIGAKLVRKAYQGDKQVFSWPFDWIHNHGGTVLLDAPTNTIHPDVTFDRANAGMVCDEDGNWTWTDKPYRRSYDVTTKGWGYLFEPQRTNLFLYSDVDGTNVTVGGTLGEKIKSPVGVAYKCVSGGAAAVTSIPFPHRPVLTAGTTYSFSAFVNGSTITLENNRLLVGGIYRKFEVDLTTGSITRWSNSDAQSLASNVKSVPYGGGWYRVSYTFVCAEGGIVDPSVFARFDNPQAGFNYISASGFQLETGPVATSPIATNGAAKTVAADVCTYQNNVLTDAAGTVLLHTSANFTTPETAVIGRNANDGNIRVTPTGGLGYWDKTNAVATAAPAGQLNAPRTGVVSYGGTQGTAMWGGGAEVVGGFDGSMNWTPTLHVGSLDGKTRFLNGYLNHLSVFPTQLPAGARKSIVSNLA